MGLSNLVALGHALETALQEAISGNIPVDRPALSLFSECRNAMHQIGKILRAEKDPGGIAIRNVTDNIQVLLLNPARRTCRRARRRDQAAHRSRRAGPIDQGISGRNQAD